ncbi:MAG: hypothetical protein II187_03455, partial [Treponema sp.]|nr:hypothetical protein [Treponema sp.]
CCGKLFHLECRELEDIQRHLAAGHGFALNPFRTVFYGLCSECAGKGNPAAEPADDSTEE